MTLVERLRAMAEPDASAHPTDVVVQRRHLREAADRIERMDAVVRAAREASYTDPTQHRATDWGAYLAAFGQRLFLLREAVDVLDRSRQNAQSDRQDVKE